MESEYRHPGIYARSGASKRRGGGPAVYCDGFDSEPLAIRESDDC